jgi:hypothetical protein
MVTQSTFLPTFGNRPERLIGRDAILDGFNEGLAGPVGHPQRANLFIGLRGMGKTALLMELADRAVGLGYVVARVTASDAMLDEIIQLVQINGEEFIPKGRKKLTGIKAGALGFSFGLTFTEETERHYGFRIKLTMLADELATHGKRILLLIDEVQSTSAQMRELATTYQHLVGERKEVAICMAGLPESISSVLNDKVLTFLNRAHKDTLGPLDLNDIALYYNDAFRRLGISIDPRTLEEAVIATRGYPYLLQLIGFNLVELAGASRSVNADSVGIAANNAERSLAQNVFEPSLRPLSNRDRQFLAAVAEDDQPSRMADVQARMRTSKSNAQQYRSRLIDHGLIAPVARGTVELTLPYFAEYLRIKR